MDTEVDQAGKVIFQHQEFSNLSVCTSRSYNLEKTLWTCVALNKTKLLV